jgi:hypothetical protein
MWIKVPSLSGPSRRIPARSGAGLGGAAKEVVRMAGRPAKYDLRKTLTEQIGIRGRSHRF